MDTAVGFKLLVEVHRLKVYWPQRGVNFDKGSMVSWSGGMPLNQAVVLTLRFMVSKSSTNEVAEDEEMVDKEMDDLEIDTKILYHSSCLVNTVKIVESWPS